MQAGRDDVTGPRQDFYGRVVMDRDSCGVVKSVPVGQMVGGWMGLQGS